MTLRMFLGNLASNYSAESYSHKEFKLNRCDKICIKTSKKKNEIKVLKFIISMCLKNGYFTLHKVRSCNRIYMHFFQQIPIPFSFGLKFHIFVFVPLSQKYVLFTFDVCDMSSVLRNSTRPVAARSCSKLKFFGMNAKSLSRKKYILILELTFYVESLNLQRYVVVLSRIKNCIYLGYISRMSKQTKIRLHFLIENLDFQDHKIRQPWYRVGKNKNIHNRYSYTCSNKKVIPRAYTVPSLNLTREIYIYMDKKYLITVKNGILNFENPGNGRVQNVQVRESQTLFCYCLNVWWKTGNNEIIALTAIITYKNKPNEGGLKPLCRPLATPLLINNYNLCINNYEHLYFSNPVLFSLALSQKLFLTLNNYRVKFNKILIYMDAVFSLLPIVYTNLMSVQIFYCSYMRDKTTCS
ncbi:hypothetical protein AGLY_011260 [Aphis glycines]|uniref:Uncharacterized protein n=1 Tax=Aphis glycines TaxID=307491 RepID=A0A6G0TDJ2_APHGL|nr:hypothetical protein AGLY_011260 [Aphis glycines]